MNVWERKKMISWCRQNETDVKRLENKMQKHWKEKVSKLNRNDWLNSDESTMEQERIMNNEKRTTEVKKTLGNSDIRKNGDQLANLVRQRYPIRKEKNEQEASKYMRKADSLFNSLQKCEIIY
jgi:hypothetical protein